MGLADGFLIGEPERIFPYPALEREKKLNKFSTMKHLL
jgi:hypothetical protein